jgi:hypothetical protein
MAAPTSADDAFEGYPASDESDLDPGPDTNESLGDADRAAGQEHRFEPAGRGPDGSANDEERLVDADDVDGGEAAGKSAG